MGEEIEGEKSRVTGDRTWKVTLRRSMTFPNGRKQETEKTRFPSPAGNRSRGTEARNEGNTVGAVTQFFAGDSRCRRHGHN